METLNTSNATNQSESGSQYFRKEKIVELFVLGIIEVLILFGNALVITAFFKGPRRIRTITNYFVVNLAISDLMVGVLSVPFWFTTELGKCYFFYFSVKASIVIPTEMYKNIREFTY